MLYNPINILGDDVQVFVLNRVRGGGLLPTNGSDDDA